jgi:hypothetical protein
MYLSFSNSELLQIYSVQLASPEVFVADVISLKGVVKTKLQLTFFPIVSYLIHVSSLKSQFISKAITDCVVEAVAVKELNFSSVTDISLPVNKNFVIEGIVESSLDQLFFVQANVGKEAISKACAEILIFDPALLKSKTVIDMDSIAQFLGH